MSLLVNGNVRAGGAIECGEIVREKLRAPYAASGCQASSAARIVARGRRRRRRTSEAASAADCAPRRRPRAVRARSSDRVRPDERARDDQRGDDDASVLSGRVMDLLAGQLLRVR